MPDDGGALLAEDADCFSGHFEHASCGAHYAPAERKIMIVFPGRLFRDCIQSVLQGPQRIFIGNCETLDQVGCALATLPPPDLFLVGLGQYGPSPDAFAEVQALRSRVPSAGWIVLTRRTGGHFFLRGAVETGVHGLLPEDSPREVLQLVTQLVLLGHSFVPTEMAKSLSKSGAPADAAVKAPSTRRPAPPPPMGGAVDIDPIQLGFEAGSSVRPVAADPQVAGPMCPRRTSLSNRENEVLQFLVVGHSNKLIARELGIAEATVKFHVKALLRKMGVANRTQAAISALQILNASGE